MSKSPDKQTTLRNIIEKKVIDGDKAPIQKMAPQIDLAIGLVARLRGPHGCPWDREQDHLTLRPYLIE